MRDADVRFAVRHLLAREHDGDQDTRVVEEMGVWNGAVRIDLAVINGELAGYEIKSARDTLSRLPSQAALYGSVFDRVHLVAADKHLSNALAAVPEWWGIIGARADYGETVRLHHVRESRINPQLEPIQVARLLWRDEALTILQRYNAVQGVRSAAREKVATRLVEALSLDELRSEMRRCLKDRQSWLGKPVNDQRDVPIGGVA
jgi:hypothetical protein